MKKTYTRISIKSSEPNPADRLLAFSTQITSTGDFWRRSIRKGRRWEDAVSWYKGLSRREFVQMAAAALAASGLASCSRLKTPWRFLRTEEARALAPMCDQFIPPDECPGAAWAGVVNFIDIQLCGAYRRLRTVYREGIANVERVCRGRYGKGFAEIADELQVSFLKLLEAGELRDSDWPAAKQKSFFEMLRAHTMQGFYGDPRHGGNRDRVSWKMVGLSYPPVRGQQHYKDGS